MNLDKIKKMIEPNIKIYTLHKEIVKYSKPINIFFGFDLNNKGVGACLSYNKGPVNPIDYFPKHDFSLLENTIRKEGGKNTIGYVLGLPCYESMPNEKIQCFVNFINEINKIKKNNVWFLYPEDCTTKLALLNNSKNINNDVFSSMIILESFLLDNKNE